MDIKQLRVFVMTARYGSVTRAAEAIHLTQSAVSLQLKALQEAIGVPLFRRTAAGMQLLPPGRELLSYAEAVLDAAAGFDVAAARVSRRAAGKLRLGNVLDSDIQNLGALLSAMLERYPATYTDVSHGLSGSILSQIRSGALDAGFYLGHPVDPQLHMAQLASLHYRVIAPRGWKKRVSGADWPQLAPLPWIWAPSESIHNRLLVSQFARLGITPKIIVSVDQESSALDMVKAGVGLCLMGESLATRESRAGRVALAPMTLSAELTLLCLASRRRDLAVAAIFDLAAEIWRPAEP